MRRSVLALLLVLWLGACGDDGSGDPCGEPLYGGRATDEAWRVMLDAYEGAELGAADAPTITSPTAAQVVAKDGPPPTFAWTSPIAALPRVPRAFSLLPGPARAHVDRSFVDILGAFFVGTARAHLPPITSDLYVLEIRLAGAECPLRVLTTDESWVPEQADWDELRAAPGAYTVTITSAYLVENVVTEGPYRPATSLAFEIR